jgi:hypothetical protein
MVSPVNGPAVMAGHLLQGEHFIPKSDANKEQFASILIPSASGMNLR